MSAALIAQKVKRTITKQTIKRFRINIPVTREIHTFGVSKKFITVFHNSVFSLCFIVSHKIALITAAATLLPPFLHRETINGTNIFNRPRWLPICCP
jgi:hypothetical protein